MFSSQMGHLHHHFQSLANVSSSASTSSTNTAGDTAKKLSETGLAVLCIMLAGALFSWIKIFPTDKALPYINKFVFYLGIPSLVFKGLAVQDFINDESFKWNFVLAFLVLRAIVGTIALLWSALEFQVQKWSDHRSGNREAEIPDEDLTLSRLDWIGRALQHWIAETYVNTLIFGIPMLSAIYGAKSVVYNVYASLSSLFFQLPVMLVLFEYRKAFIIPKQQARIAAAAAAAAVSASGAHELENIVAEGPVAAAQFDVHVENENQGSVLVDDATEVLIENEGNVAPQSVDERESSQSSRGKKVVGFVKFAILAVIANPPFVGILLGLFYSLVFTSNTNARYVNISGVHIKPTFMDNLLTWLSDTVTPLASFCIGLFAAKHFKGFARHLLRDIFYLIVKFLFILMFPIAISSILQQELEY
eukprot:TRINITY_DN41123_c0_g1_i2.p1 TRINITY_DN41123_c0_g1~~TRINITY_DN41123_c0_g1_i2.p1  ORF type:complete len:419 (+),score=130.44 TRINITY_DN41123_c0_g1_i2:98-1354(+)